MATGGPYSQQARTGFDPALAMAEATDPAMAIVGTGQPTNTTTRRTPAVSMEEQRSGGEQFSVGIDSPVYGWSLSDSDLGQGNVQQIRTDNFVTPVAEQKLPFGAIAARQQGLSNRRMQLEDAKAKALKDFDPLKGIRDPAAQHQAAFANYTTKVWWPETIQGAMDAMGFPTKAAAIDWMANDPEGRVYLKMKAKPMDAAAAESFGRTERGIDIMADIQANNTWLPPNQKKDLSDYLNNYGESGVPNTGESIDEFIGAGRRADPAISLGEFQKQFVNGFKQYGEQLVKEGTIRRLPGGKYEITDEQILDFEPYKEAMVQEAARAGAMGGDVEAIREHFDAIIKPQIERKTRSWSREKPSGGLGSGEAVKKGGDYPLSESKLPTFIREDKPKQGEPGYGVIKNENDKYQTISLTEPVSKKEQIPQTRSFVKNGDDTPMIPLRLMDVDGTLYIVGKESRYTGETSVGGSSGGGRVSLDDEDETPAAVSSIADFKRLPDIRVPYSGNETVFEEYFPGLNEESVMEIFGSRSKGKKGTAPTPEEFNSKWAKLPKGSSMIGPDGETYIKE
jgi:hypothetical protein